MHFNIFQLAAKLYLDSATLSWDGNTVSDQENILKFHEALPASEHVVDGFDAQPVASVATCDQLTFLVMVGGTVKFGNMKTRCFSQTFLLTVPGGGSCKIASDTYRTFD
jgi:NTF2-related export protein 1/2